MSKTPEQMAEEAINNRWKISGMPTSSDGYVNTLMIRIGGYKDGFIDGYQAAKDQVADADKVMNSSNNSNGWISVKERLPEQGQCVLIYNPLEYVSIVMANYYNVTRPFFDHVTLDDIHFTIYPDEEKQLHWMPLPKPPEEK